MYHSLIPKNQRSNYLDLLGKAEKLIISLPAHPEHLPLVIEAASAVRGSEEIISRIKLPLTAQHIVTLSNLLQKSRTYVRNFWDMKESTPASDGSTVGREKEVIPSSRVNDITATTKVLFKELKLDSRLVGTTPTQPINPPSPTLNSQLSTLQTLCASTSIPSHPNCNIRHPSLNRNMRNLTTSTKPLTASLVQ